MKIIDVPGSGSVANQTRSRNRFGQYVRNRTVPTNPSSPAQVTSRAAIAAADLAWQALSDQQRSGWNEMATLTFTRPGLPDPRPLTGHLFFVRAYMVGSFYTGVLPTDPPPSVIPFFTLTAAEVVLGVGTVIVNWTAGSGNRVAYFLTEPVPATWAFNTCRRPRLLGSFAGTPPVNIAATYLAAFGSLPSTGQVVYGRFCEVTAVGLGPPMISRAVQP